jgi:hypothetical protein
MMAKPRGGESTRTALARTALARTALAPGTWNLGGQADLLLLSTTTTPLPRKTSPCVARKWTMTRTRTRRTPVVVVVAPRRKMKHSGHQ